MSSAATHLTGQSCELAEGNNQVVKHVTAAIVSSYHCTFSER